MKRKGKKGELNIGYRSGTLGPSHSLKRKSHSHKRQFVLSDNGVMALFIILCVLVFTVLYLILKIQM